MRSKYKELLITINTILLGTIIIRDLLFLAIVVYSFWGGEFLNILTNILAYPFDVLGIYSCEICSVFVCFVLILESTVCKSLVEKVVGERYLKLLKKCVIYSVSTTCLYFLFLFISMQ